MKSRDPWAVAGALLLAAIVYIWAEGVPHRPSGAGDRRATTESTSTPVREHDQTGRHRSQAGANYLTEMADGALLSPAKLRYTKGSAEGHRLKHVLRHDNDLPNRPGKHGVFDGGSEDLLRMLDEAYRLVEHEGHRVSSRRDGGRSIHDVDMRRRVGFIGGQTGKRMNNPPATKIRLILERDRVITAYPF